ncbi:hypothetical protein TNCV_1695621 [Trichonephila clavipes]|nr:hypothetical protein TNCV_1695621 [Trichonephila clavipes]
MAGLSRVRARFPQKTRRVGERCTLNLSRASHHTVGVVVRERGMQAQVSSSSLDLGSNYEGVWSPRTAKTAAHLFMDAMRLIIDFWGILFHSPQEVQSQVSGDSSRRPLVAQQCVVRACPKHARLIQVRGEHAGQSRPLYCFSFKHVLHQTQSSMRSRHYHPGKQRGISNGYSVRG